jgi:hypothetical protein
MVVYQSVQQVKALHLQMESHHAQNVLQGNILLLLDHLHVHHVNRERILHQLDRHRVRYALMEQFLQQLMPLHVYPARQG